MPEHHAEPLLFLPGASGNTQFWEPVAARLAHPGARRFMGYPGFGGTPPDPRVDGLDALVERVVAELTAPTHVIAQSMGGVLALRAALARPGSVSRLVLSATSGGLDVARLGGSDWRAEFARNVPGAPAWFMRDRSDLTALLPGLTLPVLLLWGDADPISPVAVGEALRALLPRAELVVIPGGDHDVAMSHAELVAGHIARFLAA